MEVEERFVMLYRHPDLLFLGRGRSDMMTMSIDDQPVSKPPHSRKTCSAGIGAKDLVEAS